MISAIVGSITFLAVVGVAIKIATGNNAKIIQPIAQLLGIACFSLVFISLVIG